MKLQTNVFFRTIGLLALVVVSVSVAMSTFTVREHRKSEKRRAEAIALLFSGRLERLLLWEDRMTLRILLEDLVAEQDTIAYVFVERDGRPYVHTFPEGVPIGLLGLHETPAVARSAAELRDREGQIFNDIASAVGQTDGTIRIGLSQSAIDRQTIEPCLTILAIGLGALVFGSVMAAGISFAVTREVRVLTRKLKETAEEKFRAMVETTSDLIWEVNAECVFTYASPRVKHLLGYEPEEVIGKARHDFMPPEEARRVAGLLRKSVEGCAPFTRVECTSLHKEGALVTIESSGVPILNADGTLLGYRGIDRDVTQYKRTEHALRDQELELRAAEEELRLAAVAFNTGDSIIITDADGKILRVNQSFTAMTGYPPHEAIGRTPRILQSGRHGDDFYRQMWGALCTKGHWSGEVWNKRRNGQEYLQRLTIASVRNTSGEITHFVGDGQDLTEEKRAEADRVAIEAARRVQESLFPSESPYLCGIDIAGVVYPAEHASGDYYDFISLPGDSVAFLVADVCGHGLGPALLMAQTQAYVRALAAVHDDPGEILTDANRFLRRIGTEAFVTMILVHFNPLTNSIVYCCAGHPGYLLRSSGEMITLQTEHPPIGILEDQVYASAATTALELGDLLLLATDGVWESSRESSTFGEQQMLELVCKNRGRPANEIAHLLCQSVRGFAATVQDDITVVVVKRT